MTIDKNNKNFSYLSFGSRPKEKKGGGVDQQRFKAARAVEKMSMARRKR